MSCLNVKALVGAFNQEKALVGAFSVIVKTDCGTALILIVSGSWEQMEWTTTGDITTGTVDTDQLCYRYL